MSTSPISLFYIRKEYFEWGSINEGDVISFWDLWRKQDTYIVLQKEHEMIIKGIDGSEFIDYKVITKAIKCSKRGNDVYFFRVRNRLDPLIQLCKKDRWLIKKRKNVYYSNILFITLTYDVKRCTVKEAWEQIGKEWNKFLSYLKKKYGFISVLRTWESFENNYPHIHAVIIFHQVEFPVIRIPGKKYDTWRLYDLQDRKDIARGWHSFVDIQAVQSTKRIIYILKYITKNQIKTQEREKQKRTLAMMWLFRKQSFSISGDFILNLSFYLGQMSDSERLEQFMHNSNQNSTWEFIGIFTAEELGIKDTNKFTIVFETIPDIVLKVV